eukprot:827688-Pelagomonas_calceolata.AAC.1
MHMHAQRAVLAMQEFLSMTGMDNQEGDSPKPCQLQFVQELGKWYTCSRLCGLVALFRNLVHKCLGYACKACIWERASDRG